MESPNLATCTDGTGDCRPYYGELLHALGHLIGMDHNQHDASSIMRPPESAGYGDYQDTLTLTAEDRFNLREYSDDGYRFYRKLALEETSPCQRDAAVDECAESWAGLWLCFRRSASRPINLCERSLGISVRRRPRPSMHRQRAMLSARTELRIAVRL